jgi:CRP/FNR family cyclic AMP-dependent transcriptional regulator
LSLLRHAEAPAPLTVRSLPTPATSNLRRVSPHSDFFDNCVDCKLRRVGFACDFRPETSRAFDALTFTTVYPAGALMFAEGQLPRGVFILCHGRAKLSISSGDGKTLIVRIAQAGELLGLAGVMTGNNFKSTAETLEPSQVNFVRRDEFLRFLDDYPEAWSSVGRQLSMECEAGEENIRSLGLSHSATDRLARLIMSWAAARGTETADGTRVQVLMTQEDISQLIGTSRETISRLMKELRLKRIISIKRSVLTVHNRAALEALILL